jgi:hypothetical protein
MFYKSLFNFIYRFSENYKIPQLPEGVAYFCISILFTINSLTLMYLFLLFWNEKVMVNPLYYLLLILSIFIMNYYLFLYKEKYIKINEEFKKRLTTSRKRRIMALIIISYILMSIFAFIFVGLLVTDRELLIPLPME